MHILHRIVRRLVLPVAGILCASCAGPAGNPSVVRNVEHSSLYSPQMVRWAAADRDLTLVMAVNAAPGLLAAWEQTTGDALSDLSTLAIDHVTASPDGSQRSNFHLAVVVDAPISMTASQACQGVIEPGDLVPVSGQTHILVAFCNDDKAISTARAVTDVISDPASEVYIAALQAAATQALPRNNPEQAKGSEPFPFP